MAKKGKILIFSLVLVLLIAVIEVFYVCFLPKIVKIDAKLPIIAKIVKEYTDKTFEVDKIDLKTYPSFAVQLSAKSISVYNNDNTKLFFANNPSVKIQPLSLLFKTIKIDRLKTDEISLDLTGLQEEIYSGKFDLKREVPFNINVNSASIDIGNYLVSFKDAHLKKMIFLKGSKFELIPLSRKLSQLSTDGTFDIDSKICAFNLSIKGNFLIKNKFNFEGYSADGNISNIDLQTISPYLNAFTDYKNAKGIINVNIHSEKRKNKDNLTELNVVTKNISVNEGDLHKQILANGLTTLNARFFANGKVINFEDLKVDNKNFAFSMKGKILNYRKEIPNLDLSFVISPTKAENVVDIIPYGLLKELDIVKECGVFGDVIGQFSVKGKFPKLELDGAIQASDVHAVRGFEKTHTGKINVVFSGSKSDITVEVDTPHGAKFLLNGIADVDQNVPSKFDMHTENGNMPLDMVKAILVPVSRLFRFQLGPVPMFDVKSGTGNAELHILGNRETAKINGFVNVFDGNATFEGVNASLGNINLRLDFNERNVNFKTKSATINGYPASVYGLCTLLGDVNIHIDTPKINANVLKNILLTSNLTKEMTSSLNTIEKVNGNIKTSVYLHGHVDRFSKDIAKELSKLDLEGKVQMLGNTLWLQGFKMPISSVNGNIVFTEDEIKGENLQIKIGSSPLIASIKGVLSQDDNKSTFVISATGNNLNLNDTMKFVSNADISGISLEAIPALNARHSLKLSATIDEENIDLRKVNAEVKIISADTSKQLYVPTGEILVKDGNVTINGLSLKADKSNLFINGTVKKFYAKKPIVDLFVNGSNIAVQTVCKIASSSPKIKKFVCQIKDCTGTLNINLRVSDKGLLGNLTFKNLSFRHIKSDIPFSFKDLPIKFTNKSIILKNIAGEIGRTGSSPLFANVTVDNYLKIPVIKASIAVKPTTLFIERYINTKLSHPFKLTGDAAVNVNINGSVDSLGIYPTVKINKDADISYLSVNLGDTDDLREFTGEMFLKTDKLDVKKINYIKYPMSSDGRKISIPMWTMNGQFKRQGNIFVPHNVAFTTHQNLPAKILNFVFKKSLIKNGTFGCVLKYKEVGKYPKLFGVANISNAEIPLYNLKIRNGKLSADEKKIHILADGDLVSTKYRVQTDVENSLTLPIKIKETKTKIQYLNLTKLIAVLNQWSIDSYKDLKLKTAVSTFKISDILVEKGLLQVNSIDYKNCPISDFQATFSLDKNSVLKIDTEKFKITDGIAHGSISYNVKTGETQSNVRMQGVDSNIIASSFLGLKNQITGKLDGNAKITTIGLNDRDRLRNTNGIIGFHMENGTIPKLGSIEYLLRASTLLRSGFLSLSVNNFIELLKPFKTGTFSKISGCLYLKDGILKDVAVFSQGENLSLYLTGDYDISESESHAIVYGKLGKKTEGLFGPIGNLSASTLFALIPVSENVTEYEKEISKIPDIEYKNHDVRVFRATVDGDINLDKVTSSFKWIK